MDGWIVTLVDLFEAQKYMLVIRRFRIFWFSGLNAWTVCFLLRMRSIWEP